MEGMRDETTQEIDMATTNTTPQNAELTTLIRDFREAGYPMMMDRPKAAELLGVNPNNLWKHTRNGKIPATRYGTGRGVLRYSLRDLATYILSNRTV